MKIKQVVDALPSLQKLAQQDLSLKQLYKVSKLLGNLDNEIAFYNKQKNKIAAQYCDLVGSYYVPKKGYEAQLDIEMNELLEMEIECDIKEISIDCDEDVKLSYNDIVALKGFVRIEGDE